MQSFQTYLTILLMQRVYSRCLSSSSSAFLSSTRGKIFPTKTGGVIYSPLTFHHHHHHYHHGCIISNQVLRGLEQHSTLRSITSNNMRLFSTNSVNGEDIQNNSYESFFAPPDVTFSSIGVQSPILLNRLKSLGISRPSAVQASAYNAILDSEHDVVLGAETGSGKTLAYLLPLIDDILTQQSNGVKCPYYFARALILVPNKELVQQVVRMALPLCGGASSWVDTTFRGQNATTTEEAANVDPESLVRLAVLPGGISEPKDFPPFRFSRAFGGTEPTVDLLISTPAAVGPMGIKPRNMDFFADIQTLVVDEADMLLDGGYIRSLEQVLLGFRRTTKLSPTLGVKPTQHVWVAATLPDSGLRSVDAFLRRKFPNTTRVIQSNMHNARHSGLKGRTVWKEVESNKERTEEFVNLLKLPCSEGGLKDEKIMVFLNSVDDVIGVQGALEHAGFTSVCYHAKLSLEERAKNLDQFRKYNFANANVDGVNRNPKEAVSILICTDLGARGLDIPGVTVVVQLQFAGNVVAHLHRMGRCGRAGQRIGRGIVFYSSHQRELVSIVREAEHKQERMTLDGDVDDQEETTVKEGFSRRRGFTKKLKKQRRADRENLTEES
jgi:superfamily II DNA/RNA helicase